MDLNALWFSDGDGTKEGDTALAKKETSLNMNGSGSLDAEGNTIVWDEVNVLSTSGLGKEGASKTTFLTIGETQTFQLDASTLAYLAEYEDQSALTLGIRATSVNGGDNVKLNAVAEEGEDDGKSFYLTLGLAGVWQEDAATADGILNNGEALMAVTDADANGFSTVDGVDFALDNVTLRVVDGRTANPLDLTGFGAGDKVILDGKTNVGSLYNICSPVKPLKSVFTSGMAISTTGSTSLNQYVIVQFINPLAFQQSTQKAGIFIGSGSIGGYQRTKAFGDFAFQSNNVANGLATPGAYAIEYIAPGVSI